MQFIPVEFVWVIIFVLCFCSFDAHTCTSLKLLLLLTGGDKVIDVIDVARQADSKMKLSAFVKYYYSPQQPKVLNLISLEFSDTKLVLFESDVEHKGVFFWVQRRL